MTVLSDQTIRWYLEATWLRIQPLVEGAVQPASLDLRLGDTLLVWPRWVRRDPRIDQAHLWRPVSLQLAWTPDADAAHDPCEEPSWVLEPGHRYLATTLEEIHLPRNVAGQLAARSSWGRDGLDVIQGPAGFLDPGWRGKPTLELSVVGSELVIWPGASCLQLVLYLLDADAEHPYGSKALASKYQDDMAPTPSRPQQETAR